MHLLDLPDTVLMDILELLSYDEVAKKREVSNTVLHSSGRFYNVLRYVSPGVFPLQLHLPTGIKYGIQ